MEDRDTRCNPLEGLVVVPLDEYRHLVYEEARNDIVRHLLMAEKTAYTDTTALRIALGIGTIVHTTPNPPSPQNEAPDKEMPDE